MEKSGAVHFARMELFKKGLKEGRLSLQEIEEKLPQGSLSAAERWLFYYSLRASHVELLDVETGVVDNLWPSLPPG